MADISSQEAIQSRDFPPPLSTPSMSPSTTRPLRLSGFLNGDTIQVQGDTQKLRFSLQFNIQSKQLSESLVHPNSPGTFAYTPEKHSCQNSSFSSYMTPTAAGEDQSDSLVRENGTFIEEDGICGSETRKNLETTMMTRLRSGVISPVTYFPPRNSVVLGKLRTSDQKVKSKKKSRENFDGFERVLKRRSCPVRPCTSYTFFVMATWNQVRSPTFGETSKRLGRMWCQLPHKEKKVLPLAFSYCHLYILFLFRSKFIRLILSECCR